MNKQILGKKLGMTQVFSSKGLVVPVTVVEAGPNYITQIKTIENDGYEAVQVAFEEKKEHRVNKPELGVFKKAGITAKKHLRELKLDNTSELKVGDTVTVEQFSEGDKVDVVGISKGHGFTGNIKKWNHSRLKMTHGTGPCHRAVGSLGANSTPSRVMKNKKMPGHWGTEQVTIQNLEIIKVDTSRGVLLIKGAIPGARGGLVLIKNAVKA